MESGRVKREISRHGYLIDREAEQKLLNYLDNIIEASVQEITENRILSPDTTLSDLSGLGSSDSYSPYRTKFFLGIKIKGMLRRSGIDVRHDTRLLNEAVRKIDTKLDESISQILNRIPNDRKTVLSKDITSAEINLRPSQRNEERGINWLDLGEEQFKQGDYLNAINSYGQTLKQDPNNRAAWFGLSISKLYLKDFTGAIFACESALKIDPQDTNLLNLYKSLITLQTRHESPQGLDSRLLQDMFSLLKQHVQDFNNFKQCLLDDLPRNILKELQSTLGKEFRDLKKIYYEIPRQVPRLIPLKCQNCGGRLNPVPTFEEKYLVCPYCKIMHIITT